MGTTVWQPAGFPDGLAAYQEALAEVARVYGTDDPAGPAEWAARLRFAALMRGDDALAEWLDTHVPVMPWRVVWAHWRPIELWDTRALAPGWTGPVALHGFRADGAEVCLQSRYDHSYRWYSLATGAPLDGPSPDEPAAEPLAPCVSPLDTGKPFYELVEVTVTRPDTVSVHALYPVAHASEVHVLPGERVLLAGFSGAALIDFGPSAAHLASDRPAAAAPHAAHSTHATDATHELHDLHEPHKPHAPVTAPNLLPRDAWWDSDRLTPEDVRPYFHGPVLADPLRLAGATGDAPTVRALATLGLPRVSALGWLDTAQALAEPTVEDGRLLLARIDGEPALWVELATGRVVDGDDGTVNSSVNAFAACCAMTDWALSLSVGRNTRGGNEFGERYAFLAHVRASLARIDPAAAADADEWWWLEQTEDYSYSLDA